MRDYLGLNETDVTDWQFVDFKDVPRGPWSKLGENNTFVINDRNAASRLVEAKRSDGIDNSPHKIDIFYKGRGRWHHRRCQKGVHATFPPKSPHLPASSQPRSLSGQKYSWKGPMTP